MPAIPHPEIGLVIHFNYLRKREQEQGRENARYPRPCAIVLTQRRLAGGALSVIVAPITHSPPGSETRSVEIPLAVKRHLGLDDERSWVVTDEVNEFVWPGYDLQTNAVGEIAYGVLPQRLFQRIRAGVLDNVRSGRLRRVSR